MRGLLAALAVVRPSKTPLILYLRSANTPVSLRRSLIDSRRNSMPRL